MPDTELCGCTSGLRRVRCCGLDLAAQAGPASLELLDPMVADAVKRYNDKQPRESETLVLKLLDLAPNHRLAVRLLFELRKDENNQPAAEALARRLAALPAANAAQAGAANLSLAQFLIRQGRHAQAEAPARLAVQNSPRDAAAHHVLGLIFTETGRLHEGEQHYRKILAMPAPEDGGVFGNLAWNLKLQGRLHQALECYEKALQLRPDNLRAIGGHAQVQAALGNHAQAAALLDAGLAQAPGDRSLRLLRALLELLTGEPEAGLGRLSEEAGALLPAELIARGRAYLRIGQTADAITAFTTAKTQQRERYGRHYQPAMLAGRAREYTGFFTADRLAALPRPAPEPALQPVFLLGFPGSGTSLLEQLLAMIPGFCAADDLAPVSALLDLPELKAYPACLAEFQIGQGAARLSHLRARYLQMLAQSGFAADKNTYVTLRAADDAWHLGLIKTLFPQAPIIHLLRHPLDIAVTNFGRDKKLEADCGVSLEACARHYDLVMSMIRHYRGQLTLRYLPVRYETLVHETGRTISAIVEFIGAGAAIPDEPALRANPAAGAAITPGHAVAQRPVDADGIERFRRFEAAAPGMLDEIRPVLAPWIDALGYGA